MKVVLDTNVLVSGVFWNGSRHTHSTPNGIFGTFKEKGVYSIKYFLCYTPTPKKHGPAVTKLE